MLQEDQAAGLQFNPTNNALSFLLGNAMKISAVAASMVSAILIVANAIWTLIVYKINKSNSSWNILYIHN